MERNRQTAPDKEELAAINYHNETNLHTKFEVVIYNNTPVWGSLSDGEQNKKILEELPKDILEKYDKDSLRFSPLLRNHNPKNGFLVLTGIPISQKPNS